MESIVIGIAGGTGSGKSTFTNRIKEAFGDRVSVIYYDNYYKSHDDIPLEERKLINYDHPDSFETDLLVEHLHKLKNGESIQCPVYDYTVHNRTDKTIQINPAEVILVEGILVLYDPRLKDLMDIKIFVDTDADERVLRRILRDVKERKRTLDSVIGQYLATVKPMHELYVEPSKKFADLIIPEGGHNLVALELLEKRIQDHVKA